MHLLYILFFIYSCSNAEEVNMLSQNGKVYATKGQDVNLTCETDITGISIIVFIKENATEASNPVLFLPESACAPTENFTCNTTDNQYTYRLQQSNYENRNRWSCGVTTHDEQNTYSGSITIIIIEPFSSIIMTVPSENRSTINVNTVKEFVCQTSLSRPPAEILWYKRPVQGTDIQLLNGSSLQTIPNASLSWAKSTFNYMAEANDNGARILCKGRLSQISTVIPLESNRVLLNVRYPPLGQPMTDNYGTLTVNEGDNIEIQCYIVGGNPFANLSWTCNGQSIAGINEQNETLSISKLSLQATSAYNGKTCICIGTHVLMRPRTASTVLNILFQPPQEVKITSSHAGYINASSNVTLKCEVNGGNPVANATWNCGDVYATPENTILGNKVISTITFQVEKKDNGRICDCIANHFLWDGQKQENITLNVTFTPDANLKINGATNGTIFYEKDQIMLSCTVSNGNPLAKVTFECWTSVNGIDKSNSTTAVSVINSIALPSANGKTCKCTAEHMLLPTMLELVIQTTVYYPPMQPHLSFSPLQPLLEGKEVDVLCNATEGNPHITSYIWTQNGNVLEASSKQLKFSPITKKMNKQSLKCRVKNAFTENKTQVVESSTNTLDVHYIPRIVQFDETSITKSEGMTLNIPCLAIGNPIPDVQWFHGNTEVSKKEAEKSNLNLTDISRNQQGDYHCTANAVSHPYGQLEANSSLKIIVNYPPDVTVLVKGNNLTVGSSVALLCNASGQPDNYNFKGWRHSFNGKEIRNNENMQNNGNGSYILLSKLSYQDIGTYSCFVDNGIENRNGLMAQTNSTVIAVQGFPIKIPETPAYPIFTTEQRSSLIAKLYFYTFPNITDLQWYNSTTGLAVSPTVVSTNISKTTLKYKLYGHEVDFSDFAYEALFIIANFQHFHEGSYALVVSNMERMSNFTIRALISGPPDSPLHVNVSEKTDSAITLFLISGFNGGHDQMFHVVYHVLNNEDMSYEQAFVDTHTDPQFLKINNLMPSNTYKLSVFASNEKGNSTLNETLCCRSIIVQTDDKTEVQSNQQGIQLKGLAAGLAVAVFTVISIIVIMVFLRRRIPLFSKGREENGRLNLTSNVNNDEGDDGLKDNILYESAGREFGRTDCSSSTEYAMVQKKGDIFKTNANEENLQETGLYSVVNKKPKAKTTADVYVNASGDKKGKDKFKNKKKTNPSAIEDVYENMSDEARTKNNDTSVKTTRNKDGLQYAELVFNPLPNGSKFVIHGLEDRTIYAVVDTTQKIDPLPDSDDEENAQQHSSDKQDK